MYILTIGLLKGGVGKTTIAVNLALHLAAKGKKVLAIDLDVNNNLTDFFLRCHNEKNIDEANIFHVLLDKSDIEECIYKTIFDVDVIPATVGLKRLSVECGGDFLTLLPFEAKIKGLDYDYVVIDTPPYPVAELKLAMSISDFVLCPVVPKRWSFQGSDTLNDVLEELTLLGIEAPDCLLVPSLLGGGQKEQARLIFLQEKYNVVNTRVKKFGAIETAAEDSKVLKKKSKAFDIFENLTEEVLSWKTKVRR